MPNSKQFLKNYQQGYLRLSDIILGGQDGLVNVLGLVLGVAAATDNTRIILAAGLAATFAESIAMAGVAYTSRLTEHEHYLAQRERQQGKIEQLPQQQKEEISKIFAQKGFVDPLLDQITQHITSDRQLFLETMMRDVLELEDTQKNRATQAAITVGGSAVLGSLVPLVPFFLFPPTIALWTAIAISGLMLFLVGIYKAKMTIGKPWKSGLQLTIIGLLSALAGYVVGLLFSAPMG